MATTVILGRKWEPRSLCRWAQRGSGPTPATGLLAAGREVTGRGQWLMQHGRSESMATTHWATGSQLRQSSLVIYAS